MNYTKCDVALCSLDGKPIRTMEGYSVNVDAALSQMDLSEVRSFVVPGGNVKNVNLPEVRRILQELRENGKLIAGICAGVDLLDDAGILRGMRSTHSTEEIAVKDENIITARANGYVDFAIEVAKALDLFEDDADLQETIDFWKYHKSME